MDLPTSMAVAALYSAASGRSAWQGALDAIGQLLNLWVVQVLGIDKHNGQLIFSSYGGRATPQTSLDYFRYYNTIDPRVPVVMATPPDEWMHCHQHFDDGYVVGSEFYQDFLLRHGGRYVSATKLIDDSDVQFILAFMRGRHSAPIEAHASEQLAGLKHHFSEAFKNYIHLRTTFAELGMAQTLLDQFPLPMLLVDETGTIWHRNAQASVVLAEHDPVIERAGFLTSVSRRDRDVLAEAIHELLLPASAGPPRRQRIAVSLAKANGDRFLAFLSAVRPDVAMGAFGPKPRALVVFHEPDNHTDDHSKLSPFIVGECFDLTPAEANVAVGIARGYSVKELAQKNGTTETTVRSQLQAVMLKVGVDRQVDLTRILLTLPIRR